MGVMHLNGWGTARNLQQAQYFFSMAAKVGLQALRCRLSRPSGLFSYWSLLVSRLVPRKPCSVSRMHAWHLHQMWCGRSCMPSYSNRQCQPKPAGRK